MSAINEPWFHCTGDCSIEPDNFNHVKGSNLPYCTVVYRSSSHTLSIGKARKQKLCTNFVFKPFYNVCIIVLVL